MGESREERQTQPGRDATVTPPLRRLVPAKKSVTTFELTKFTVEAQVELRRQVVVFLLWAYGLLLFSTMGIVCLQGFHAWGFRLESAFLMWLGGATIAQIGGLLILTVKSVVR